MRKFIVHLCFRVCVTLVMRKIFYAFQQLIEYA